jgi:hypothetical protein
MMRSMTKMLATTGLVFGLALTNAGLAAAQDDTNTGGSANNSPGVTSGNLVQPSDHVPVNTTGNSGNGVGAINPAFDNMSSSS